VRLRSSQLFLINLSVEKKSSHLSYLLHWIQDYTELIHIYFVWYRSWCYFGIKISSWTKLSHCESWACNFLMRLASHVVPLGRWKDISLLLLFLIVLLFF
jgi:hypothetical protein